MAEALRRQDYHVSCVGVADLADPALRDICQDFQWIGWGSLGGAIRFFRRCGVEQATMAGKFHKALLYQPGVWWRHCPDWKFIKTFYHYFITHKRDNKDDTLLRRAGRCVCGATESRFIRRPILRRSCW